MTDTVCSTPQWVVAGVSPLNGSLVSLRTVSIADSRRDAAVLSKVACGMVSAQASAWATLVSMLMPALQACNIKCLAYGLYSGTWALSIVALMGLLYLPCSRPVPFIDTADFDWTLHTIRRH